MQDAASAEVTQASHHVAINLTRISATQELSGRGNRRKLYLVLAPLVAILLGVSLLATAGGAFKGGPAGVAFGADFAMFFSAAQITQAGGNPYDQTLLFRTDRSMLARDGLPITKSHALVRVGNPPLLFWAIQPLTLFHFQTVALIWMVLMALFSALGFLAALRFLGWKHWLVPLLVFALMPQVLLGPYYGNVICVVFAGVGVGLLLVRRFPVAAGAALTLALLKPPVALPVVLLIIVFHPAQRNRILMGFGLMAVGLSILTGLVMGWHTLGWWSTAMLGYSHNLQMWPDMVPLAGLYAHSTGDQVRLVLQSLSLIAAAALTFKVWWDNRESTDVPLFSFAGLSFVWFLAIPYAHPFDEILLTIPILILLGRSGHRITWRWPSVAVYLMSFSLLLFADPYHIQLQSLPIAATALCILLAGLNPRYRESAPGRSFTAAAIRR